MLGPSGPSCWARGREAAREARTTIRPARGMLLDLGGGRDRADRSGTAGTGPGAPGRERFEQIMMRWLALSLVLAAAAAGPRSVAAQTATAVVAGVIEGDSVDVHLPDGQSERVRLIGINTPKAGGSHGPAQCFGLEAFARAKELLNGQAVTLHLEAGQGERDRYGRLLAHLYLPDGRNFALVMLAEGYGHEHTYRVPSTYQADFLAAQASAALNHLGLWSPHTCGGQKSPSDLTDEPSPPARAPAAEPIRPPTELHRGVLPES